MRGACDRYQVSARKVPISLPRRFPAHGSKPMKKTTRGWLCLTGPWAISLHRRKARASEGPTDLRFQMFRSLSFASDALGLRLHLRERRRAPDIGKRKLRVPEAPKTFALNNLAAQAYSESVRGPNGLTFSNVSGPRAL